MRRKSRNHYEPKPTGEYDRIEQELQAELLRNPNAYEDEIQTNDPSYAPSAIYNEERRKIMGRKRKQ